MITLKKEITKCKIHFHCAGKKGKVTRIVNPMLGAHLAFCVERYGENAHHEQLDLRSFLETLRLYQVQSLLRLEWFYLYL